MAFDDDFASLAYLSTQHRVLPQAAHQYTGPTVNETLREPFMQRVGQFIFDLARDVLPVLGVTEPIRPIGDEGPGADLRDPARQRIDIAVDAIGLVDLAREPAIRDFSLPHQEIEQGGDQFRMRGRRDLPVVRDLTGLP